MKLPAKVQDAIDALARYELSTERVAPWFYRQYLRFRPGTPPPLFSATAGYWTALAFTVAILAGGFLTLFTTGAILVSQGEQSIRDAKTAFIFGQIIGWAVFGCVGWIVGKESRRACEREAESLGLPGWDAFTKEWRPSPQQMAERADPERYWLRAVSYLQQRCLDRFPGSGFGLVRCLHRFFARLAKQVLAGFFGGRSGVPCVRTLPV